MNYPYDKKTVLRLCALACLSLCCAVYPSEISLSTNSTSSAPASSKRWSLPSLESVSDRASEASTLPSQQSKASSVSTGSSSSSSGLKHLLIDNNHDLESEMSRVSSAPNLENEEQSFLENQRINTEKQAWWKLINNADQLAYHAHNPARKEAFARLAQEIRDEFEEIEDLLPERQEYEETTRREPLPDTLYTFADRQEQEMLPELSEHLATFEE